MCEVDGVSVHIGANRVGDLCHAALCESAAVVVGKHHLFKRSLILILVCSCSPWVAVRRVVVRAVALRDDGDVCVCACACMCVCVCVCVSQAWCESNAANKALFTWPLVLVLVYWVFLRRRYVIHHPFQALAWFLTDCAAFEWDK